MDKQERVSLEYVKRLFKKLKSDRLNSPEAVARVGPLADELKMRPLTDAASDPDAQELLAEIQRQEGCNKPN